MLVIAMFLSNVVLFQMAENLLNDMEEIFILLEGDFSDVEVLELEKEYEEC